MRLETWMFSHGDQIPCKWRECLDLFPPERVDVYYHPAYCASWLGWEDGTAIALAANDDGTQFLYCFLLSPLPWSVDPHWRYDAQSFYGYGGIVTSTPAHQEQLERFNNAVDRWMLDHGVVAEFIRANPLLHATPSDARLADYHHVRTNVYAIPPQKMLTMLDAATRRNVRKALRAGIQIERMTAAQGARIFAKLYQHTVERLGMEAFYRFPDSYFEHCQKYLTEEVEYRVAHLGGEPIAALMLLVSKKTITYHLGASDERWWHVRPNDLLFASLLEDAAQRGYSTVSFGGGTTLDSTDTLFRYKRKFGNVVHPVYVGFRIHHLPTYERLCAQWELEHPDYVERYRRYFLRYRGGQFERKVMH
jgi:hypothetical protein